MLTVGGLFSGIGGIELGLQRAGMDIRWHCERDEFCASVLLSHWPDRPVYTDVREVGWWTDSVDVLCGGFPCQDLSHVGRRGGIGGAKSGLWTEFARIVDQLRPSYVIVENVPGLLVRGMGDVLGDLADVGYDAEWDCLPAAAFGALHLRARMWLLAYPSGGRHGAPDETVFAGRPGALLRPRWPDEPGMARMAHGLPRGVDRRRALGNAVVPAVAEHIGRQIIEREESCVN